jgi:hypothetical protein
MTLRNRILRHLGGGRSQSRFGLCDRRSPVPVVQSGNVGAVFEPCGLRKDASQAASQPRATVAQGRAGLPGFRRSAPPSPGIPAARKPCPQPCPEPPKYDPTQPHPTGSNHSPSAPAPRPHNPSCAGSSPARATVVTYVVNPNTPSSFAPWSAKLRPIFGRASCPVLVRSDRLGRLGRGAEHVLLTDAKHWSGFLGLLGLVGTVAAETLRIRG